MKKFLSVLLLFFAISLTGCSSTGGKKVNTVKIGEYSEKIEIGEPSLTESGRCSFPVTNKVDGKLFSIRFNVNFFDEKDNIIKTNDRTSVRAGGLNKDEFMICGSDIDIPSEYTRYEIEIVKCNWI